MLSLLNVCICFCMLAQLHYCVHAQLHYCTKKILHVFLYSFFCLFILLFFSQFLHKEKRKSTKSKASIDCTFFGFLWMETNLPVATK